MSHQVQVAGVLVVDNTQRVIPESLSSFGKAYFALKKRFPNEIDDFWFGTCYLDFPEIEICIRYSPPQISIQTTKRGLFKDLVIPKQIYIINEKNLKYEITKNDESEEMTKLSLEVISIIQTALSPNSIKFIEGC